LKMIRYFRRSAAGLLLITGAAKIISAGGHARILEATDPVLSLTFREVFWMVGGLEVLVALYCWWGRRPVVAVGLVAWLASMFVIYRFGLVLVDYHRPCSCLGNLTDALPISPQSAATLLKIILGYLLLGGYTSLFLLWQGRRKGSLRPGLLAMDFPARIGGGRQKLEG